MRKVGSVSDGDGRGPPNGPTSQPLDLVLYVEDDDDNFRIAQLRLGKSYQLLRARDAAEACRILSAQSRELTAVLMDIGLAGSQLNGIELTELVRGKLPVARIPAFARDLSPMPSLPIIFVTAQGDKYSDARLLLAGGDRVMQKPVDFMALSLALTQLSLARAQRRKI